MCAIEAINSYHRSLIHMRERDGLTCITSSLESTSRFILSASPFLSRFISSSTCQPISLIPAHITHHSFTLSLQAQNLPFQQILSTWVGCGPAQSPPCCTKCNSPPINSQCTSYYSMWHYNCLWNLKG